MKHLATGLLTALLASACATQPISNREATLAPLTRIYSLALTTRHYGDAAITVKRDIGLGGAACSTRIYFNARDVADINPGEKVVIYAPAGDHLIGARPNGICAGGLAESRLTAKADGEYSFRVGYNDVFGLFPTAF